VYTSSRAVGITVINTPAPSPPAQPVQPVQPAAARTYTGGFDDISSDLLNTQPLRTSRTRSGANLATATNTQMEASARSTQEDGSSARDTQVEGARDTQIKGARDTQMEGARDTQIKGARDTQMEGARDTNGGRYVKRKVIFGRTQRI